MSNQASIQPAASLPRRRFWPNPDKKLGLCDIYELEKELNDRKKGGIFLNPMKRLRDCNEEELEEQLKLLREYKKADTYPNPEKELKDCKIQELEDQLKKVKAANAEVPRKCSLPMICDSIFCDVITQAFLSREDIVNIMKVKEISGLYCLQKRFCALHGVKLRDEPNSNPPDLSRKRKREDKDGSETTSITCNELYDGKARELQTRANALLPPLKAGEYDAILPITANRLMLECHANGRSVTFLKYVRFPDGQKGPAELHQLIRNEGDSILTLDGMLVSNKFIREFAVMIRERQQNNYVILRMVNKDQRKDFIEWKAKNPSLNPRSCECCQRASDDMGVCDGGSRGCGVKKWFELYQCIDCNKQGCNSCHRTCPFCRSSLCRDCEISHVRRHQYEDSEESESESESESEEEEEEGENSDGDN